MLRNPLYYQEVAALAVLGEDCFALQGGSVGRAGAGGGGAARGTTEAAPLRESEQGADHAVSSLSPGCVRRNVLRRRLSGEVQLRVSEDFRDCIRRLEGYVDSYRKSFSDSPEFLPAYKQVSNIPTTTPVDTFSTWARISRKLEESVKRE